MRKKIRFTLFIISLLLITSQITAALTPGQEETPQIFIPVDDTNVDESRPTRNYGSRTSIKADALPTRNIYLKFNVQGVGVAPSAALRFYARSSNSIGLNIHTVSDTTWNEDTMVWDNAPPIGQIVASTGPIQGGNWYVVDISSAITGDGLVSLAITNPHSTATSISSKESNEAPELYIPAAFPGSPDPFVVRRDGDTYYTESQTTSSSYSVSLKFVVESAAYELNSFDGGTITFQAGEFDLGAEWFEFYDLTDITFEGQGIDVTVVLNVADAETDTEPFDFSRSDRITIHDMTVSAGGPPRSTSDALDFDAGDYNTVERVKVTSSRGRGIVFDGKDIHAGVLATADNNIVRDCVITGIPGDGIELLASSSNRIENCEIVDVGGHGIQINKSSSIASQPDKKPNDNIISGNYIDNAGGDGINLISGDRNILTGNTILNSSDDKAYQDGIQITSGNSISCDDNIVEFNTATDNQTIKTQRYGLSISSSYCNRTVVADNDFSGNENGDILDIGTDTIFTSSDTTPPTVPTNLAVSLVTQNQVDLVWNASTDNVGVNSYTIYRDNTPVGTVDGATTTFQDNTVAQDTIYIYTVEAFDIAGNNSGQSSPLQVTTPPPPPDNEPPSIPTNLITTSVTYAAVDLAWDTSTDNVGVASYIIYRDGVLLDSVDGTITTFQDSTVTSDMSYTYHVEAFDAAGNGSGQSVPLPVIIPSTPSTFTFIAVADSYVDESAPTTIRGTSSLLRVDGSPLRYAYLRFDVEGLPGTVTQATLRVYANSSSSVGYDVHQVSDNTWDEATLNFTNAPTFGPVEASSGSFSAGLWTEVDVTLLISGDGTYSLALTTPHTTAISFGSRESVNPPELIISVGP
jgi:parallel beta-helix repeat protein